MATSTFPARPTPPARPIVPRPLWEAHRLFQEPEFPDGLGLLEDEGPEDDSDG